MTIIVSECSSFNYIGCYADIWDAVNFDIKPIWIQYAGMTVEYCIGYCFNHGYLVAGLQGG